MMPIKIPDFEINETVHDWTIVSPRSKAYYVCRCKCGTVKRVSKYHLISNKSTSCGKCYQSEFLGKKFGKLTVLSIAPPRIYDGKRQNTVWRCLCECGAEVKRTSSNLRLSKTPGCHRPGCDFEYGLAAKHRLYDTYKRSSAKRGLSFEIAFNHFITLTSMNCHYCGAAPSSVQHTAFNNGDYVYNGLDRLNNNVGYLDTNVVACCKFCNSAKLNRSIDEFKAWVQLLWERRNEY